MSKGTGLKYLMMMLVFCGFLSGSLLGYFLPAVKSSASFTRLEANHGKVHAGMPLMVEEREIEADDECSDWSHLLLPAWVSCDYFIPGYSHVSAPVMYMACPWHASVNNNSLYKHYKVYRI